MSLSKTFNFFLFLKAHCVYGYSSDPSRFTIGLGYFDRNQLNSWSVIKRVTRIIIHASYNSNTVSNDIALMKLDVSENLKKKSIPDLPLNLSFKLIKKMFV